MADGAQVVLTTSGTHDPAEGSRAPAPNHANARLLAMPAHDPQRDRSPRVASQRSYASAKLCVVLYGRALAARRDHRDVTVIAYDPGPTPGTGLGRSLPAPLRLAWERTPGMLRWLLRGKSNTIAAAGAALADLATGDHRAPEGPIYAALRSGTLTWPELSQQARQDELVDALIQDSDALLRQFAPAT